MALLHSQRLGRWVLILVLGVLPCAWGVVRLVGVDYRLDRLIPDPAYRVHLRAEITDPGDDVRLGVFLPQNESNVSLGARWLHSDFPGYRETYLAGNRLAEWTATEPGTYRFESAFTAAARPVRYAIDPALEISGPGQERGPFLKATRAIQAEHPRVAALAKGLAPAGTPVVTGLRAIHDRCRALASSASGPQDALSALHRGAASSLGRSRLFVALARHQGLPARTVTGLLLKPGTAWSELTWVEVRIGAGWIPFCPTRDVFAAAPADYLPIRRGGEGLLVHGNDARVRRQIEIERTFDVKGRFDDEAETAGSGWLGLWSAFEDAGVPIDLLRIILMIPLGALVLVLLRNIVGIQTFGFFLPLLIAVASIKTGLAWGLAGFFALVAFMFLIRIPLDRQRLLHFPQMAILLTVAIGAMLGLATLGLRSGNLDLSHITFFPFAILTITTERFSVMVEEEGVARTLQVTLMSAVSIAICHAVLTIAPVQALFLGFPELFLPVVLVNYRLGRWMGVRLLEYWRFRRLVVPPSRVRHA